MELNFDDEFKLFKLGLLCVSLEKGYLFKVRELQSYVRTLNAIKFRG